MTPREYDSLVKGWATREERQDSRTAIISAILLNVNRVRGGRRYKPEDFIPDYLGKRVQRRPQTQDELWERVNQSMAALGGS